MGFANRRGHGCPRARRIAFRRISGHHEQQRQSAARAGRPGRRNLPPANLRKPSTSARAGVMTDLPSSIRDVEHLEDLLSEPTPYLIEAFRRLDGDVLVLGVAGKMGPT